MSLQTGEKAVEWPSAPGIAEWLKDKPTEEWKKKFGEDGYLIVQGLLTKDELEIYQAEKKRDDSENICQIMWPSIFVQNFDNGPLHQRSKAIAKIIVGNDAEFDFDMFLSKAPHTDTETPWHQDASYWPDVGDARSASCWVALDDAYKDNGCMWFVPGSHRNELREHRRVSEECHVRVCDVNDKDVKLAAEIPAGSCTFHHGRTLHYTRGNSTDKPRRAYVAVYRPADIVKIFREQGFDHGKTGLKGIIHGITED